MHTRYSYDSLMDPQKLIDRCIEVGLNCIAVTDHNSLAGAWAVQKIAPFRVILGEEIKTSAGEIIGLFITEEIPSGLTPEETIRRIKDQGGIVSLPHPFDRMGRSPLDSNYIRDLLPYIDIIEGFNARTILQRDNNHARDFAAEKDLLVTSVSDAHTLGELGRSYTEIPDFDGTARGFIEALTEANLIKRPSSPLVHLFSTLNKFRSRKRPEG